jgi:hypothetical protein
MLRVVFWSALTLYVAYWVIDGTIGILARGGPVCTTSTEGGAISDHCSFGAFPGEFLLQNVLWFGWYGLLGILAVLAATNSVSAIRRFRRIEPDEQGLWVALFLLAIALIAASKDLVFTDGKVICITTNGIEDCIQRNYSKFVPAAAFLAAITGLVCVGIPLTRHYGGPPAQHAGA